MLFLALSMATSVGLAQVAMGTNIPESSSLSISHSVVSFDLASALYPPPTFPTYYYPTEPDPVTSPLSYTVFTNLENWSVDVAFTGLLNVTDNVMLPPDRLEYSTDEGLSWHAFALGGNTIVQRLEGTSGFETFNFAVRLQLRGDELPGAYEGVLTFTLATE